MSDIKKISSASYCKYSLLAVFATFIFNKAYASEQVIGVASTVLVESSSEVIPNDLSVSNLPKTLSLGWENEADVLELKRQLVDFNLVGPKTCMSWLYIRTAKKTRLFMLSLVGSGIVRINNENFESLNLGSYLHASPTIKSFNERIGRNPIPDIEKRVSFNFGFEVASKSRKNVTCTFTNVKCRRYEFSEFPITFGIPAEPIKGQQTKNTQLVVKNSIKTPVSFFAEDMCPHTSKALVESRQNHRMGETGDLFNALIGGIYFNRDIKKALMEDLKENRIRSPTSQNNLHHPK